MDLTVDIGMEQIQRNTALLLIQNLNDAIADQNTLWMERDEDFYVASGRTNPEISVEEISTDHIYSGTIPSLIDKPMEFYPNCCVIAYIAQPQRGDDDWMERYQVALALEIMVKSESSEEEVNARIHRTLAAANFVIASDKNRRLPDADGESLVPQISGGPAVTIGEVFVKHKGTDPNDRWFYQGGSLTYLVDKFSSY